MSDISSAAGGGVIGAAFMAGVNWATSFFKSNRNGNERKKPNDDVEYGMLIQKVSTLQSTTDGLVRAVGELQTEVAVAATNIQRLTSELGRRST